MPLRTVEFQKAMSRIFKYSGHKCMQIAEKLYNGGYLSYPRTETDRYSSDFDFEHILKSLADDIFLGDFVKSLMSKEISAPRKGKNDDRAHPPIHPLKSGSELSGDERRVFDYVTRRFLASLCLDAEYSDTLLNCRVGDELFFCQGKMLLKKNYLDVFTYDTFQENTIPNFKEGDILEVYSLKVHSGSTTSPSLLNEADLINAMDKNGIGTDATIHEHIQKVLERGYAINDHGRFIPTPLGVGLVVGYDQIFSDLSLTKPYMRAQLEEDVQKISRGTLNPEYVIDKYLRSFEDVLDRIGNFFHILVGTIDYYKLNMKSFTPQESNGESLPNHSKETHNNGKRPRKKGLTRPRKREKPCSTEDLSGDVRCRCGLIAVERTSKTSSSHGKKFYSCSKKVYRCDFFEWKN